MLNWLNCKELNFLTILSLLDQELAKEKKEQKKKENENEKEKQLAVLRFQIKEQVIEFEKNVSFEQN